MGTIPPPPPPPKRIIREDIKFLKPKRRIDMEGRGPWSKEDDEKIKKQFEDVFGHLSETFDETFKRADDIFKKSERIFESAEKKMRDSEARMKEKMETTTEKILRRRKNVKEMLKTYDFTVNSDDMAKQLMKDMKIKPTILIMSVIAGILFAYMMISLTVHEPTTPQPLNPPALEETIQVNPDKKL